MLLTLNSRYATYSENIPMPCFLTKVCSVQLLQNLNRQLKQHCCAKDSKTCSTAWFSACHSISGQR